MPLFLMAGQDSCGRQAIPVKKQDKSLAAFPWHVVRVSLLPNPP